ERWRAHGLPTADACVVAGPEELDAACVPLPDFPLFVKPLHEGSSKGISSPHSIVYTREALAARVAQVCAWYGQPALVETYLPGREFTIGVLGNGAAARVLGIAEVNSASPGNISGFNDKEEWEQRAPDYYTILAAGPLHERLTALALRAYHAVHCLDLGRVDVRLDAMGEPQLLEINPLPALHPTHSAFTLLGRHAGLPYETLIATIVDQARQRWGPVA
ncbi:MAG: D-alanine--D-alanine ligase, partial [Anaerolineae bacterium]|nr:D-alanine--D-alanine ligase [Anaerolineae bacterium]